MTGTYVTIFTHCFSSFVKTTRCKGYWFLQRVFCVSKMVCDLTFECLSFFGEGWSCRAIESACVSGGARLGPHDVGHRQ
jgi:hypothetical protein